MAARTNTLNNQGKNFGDILDQNTNGSNDLLVQLLRALGIGSTGEITGTDRKDWNKQLLDTLVSHQSTLENRQYNESLRDEQRIYDNPMSQLARLMGAGISRDQAIQMLSSGGSGSGGSAVPYSEPSAIAEGIAPSQSDLNHAQAVTAKLNTGLGFVSAAAGLVSLGFSAAQAIPQINLLKNQEYLSSKQRQSFDDAGTAFRLISKSGKVSKDTFGSIKSVSDAINSLYKNGDLAAKDFVDNGGMDRLRQNSIYSLPFLNQMYKNELEPNYYARQLESALRLQESQTNLNMVDSNKALVETAAINANIDKIRAETAFVEGETNLQAWHQKLYESQVNLNNEQANQIKLDNEVKSAFYHCKDNEGRTGIQLLTDRSFGELKIALGTINAEINSELWQKQVDSMCANYEHLEMLYLLQYMYNKGEFDAVDSGSPQYQNYLYLCRAAQQNGVFGYIDARAKAGSAGRTPLAIPAFRGKDNPLDPEYDPYFILRGR